ncbi:MAG: hypothetical protein NTX25_01395 [Proteobacteria bacterium]|nr:hypothetical protein [Pseudomonadota bacterium]
MTSEFLTLAMSIKHRLEARFSPSLLINNYVYTTLNELILEYQNGNFSSKRTDIGIAAVKMFDSNSNEDNELVSDISRLAKLYKIG